jgi:hypothetical protein
MHEIATATEMQAAILVNTSNLQHRIARSAGGKPEQLLLCQGLPILKSCPNDDAALL